MDRYEFSGTVLQVTLKAVLMRLGEKEVWLPRSQCHFQGEPYVGEVTEVSLPEWLVIEKELEDESA